MRTSKRVVALRLEELEPRRLLSGAPPSPAETEFLERLNDARANPAAYGASIGLDLTNVSPSQPLAFDTRLVFAAEQHSLDMNARAYFAHNTPEGVDPGARLTAAGFNWDSWGESIAGGSVYAQPADALKALIIDAGVPDLGHRKHLLAIDPTFQSETQVGIGVVQNGTGPLTNYYTIDTAGTSPVQTFLTGVIYTDVNHNGVYDAGEGIAGATISVVGAGSASDFASGAYAVPLSAGTYTVIVSGPGMVTTTRTVTIQGSNVRLNFLSDGSTTGGGNPQLPPLPGNLGDVADIFTHSAENYSNFVTNAYATYLKRAPDAPGLADWVNRMANGLSDGQVEAFFLGSAEYIQNHGGSNAAWVLGMYHDLLGRTPADSEVSYWLNQMAAGEQPQDVAFGFAASAEREGMRVRAIYETYLNRTPGADEVNYWVNRFIDGASNEEVTAGFIASQEYYATDSQNNPVIWIRNVYGQVLHRTPADSEVTYWLGQLH